MNTSPIEWTDMTWNPTSGCSKVSQGCRNCYAERVFPRVYGRHRDFTYIVMHPARLNQPLRLRRGRKIFVNSMSDLFHESVSDSFLDLVFAVMALCPQHTFQILTKRPDRMRAYLRQASYVRDMQRWVNAGLSLPDLLSQAGQDRLESLKWPLPNVWLGVSVEDQATADERIPLLLQTPAAVRFISAEPLLGSIDLMGINAAGWDECFTAEDARGRLNALTGWCYIEYPENGNWIDLAETDDTKRGKSASKNHSALDLVIAGGESGPKARPSHPEWFAQLRNQCHEANVPFFFKQWGEWAARSSLTMDSAVEAKSAVYVKIDGTAYDVHDKTDRHQFDASDVMMYRAGKKNTGRTLDGREHSELPCTAA